MPADREGADLRVPPPAGPPRGASFTFTFEGEEVCAHSGETVGAALLAAGIRSLRTTRVGGRPRGLFCGIGSCYDCLVTVNGQHSLRACLTPVRPGDRVEVQDVPRLG